MFLWNNIWSSFSYLVQRHTTALFFSHFISSLLFLSSPLTSSPLVMSLLSSLVLSRLLWPCLISSHLVSSSLFTPPPPLLLLGLSSLCLLCLVSHFVKDLPSQPSDRPRSPAGDEAILILSGITAKLVVFSIPDCSRRVRMFRHTDLHLHWHLRS